MKGVLLLLLLVALASSQKTNGGFSKVIYGEDGRLDTYQLGDFDRALGASTVIVIEGYGVLSENDDGTYTASRTATAEKFWDFCSSERYSDQDILANGNAFCSGFLISSQWIGTAAHCSLASTNEYIIIFGFELLSSSNTRLTFEADDVYTVSRIVAVGSPTGGANDYGILELDRPVVGYTPYTKINNNINVDDSLTLIGHPVGLPKKTDKGGKVTAASQSVIRGTVDSYGGNSGSPIFDENGLLVGILVGGSADFVNDGGCEISNVCPGNSGCEFLGEYIVPICSLITANTDVEEVIGINCEETQDDGNFTYSYLEELSSDVANSSSIISMNYVLLISSLCFSFFLFY